MRYATGLIEDDLFSIQEIREAGEQGGGYVKSLNKDYCEICYKLFLLRYEELLNKSK